MQHRANFLNKCMSAVMVIGYAIAFILVIYAFARIYEAQSIPLIKRFDYAVLSWVGETRNMRLDVLFMNLTWAGSFHLLGPVTATLAAWLAMRRSYIYSVFMIIAFGGAALITYLSKLLVERERPDFYPHLVDPSLAMAFPSGHATHIAAFSVALYLVIRRMKARWHLAAAILLGAITLIVASSRIYLQVHYPSDVLAGLGIGILWVIGVDAILQQLKVAMKNEKTD